MKFPLRKETTRSSGWAPVCARDANSQPSIKPAFRRLVCLPFPLLLLLSSILLLALFLHNPPNPPPHPIHALLLVFRSSILVALDSSRRLPETLPSHAYPRTATLHTLCTLSLQKNPAPSVASLISLDPIMSHPRRSRDAGGPWTEPKPDYSQPRVPPHASTRKHKGFLPSFRHSHPDQQTRGIAPEGESGRRGIHPFKFLKICSKSSSKVSGLVNILWPFVPAAIAVVSIRQSASGIRPC